MVVFESEEAARARENDPRRQEGLQAASAMMAEIFDGAPEFVDLTVVDDVSPLGEAELPRPSGRVPSADPAPSTTALPECAP